MSDRLPLIDDIVRHASSNIVPTKVKTTLNVAALLRLRKSRSFVHILTLASNSINKSSHVLIT